MELLYKIERVNDQHLDDYLVSLDENTHGRIFDRKNPNTESYKFLNWNLFRSLGKGSLAVTVPIDQHQNYIPTELFYMCTRPLPDTGRKLFACLRFRGTKLSLLFPAKLIEMWVTPSAFIDVGGQQLQLSENEFPKHVRVLMAPATEGDNSSISMRFLAYGEAVFFEQLANNPEYGQIDPVLSNLTAGVVNKQQLYGF